MSRILEWSAPQVLHATSSSAKKSLSALQSHKDTAKLDLGGGRRETQICQAFPHPENFAPEDPGPGT